jgi:thiamine biosynthesis lipoprotein
MGTLVSVTGIDVSRDFVEEAAAKAFQEMDRVVDLLNRYDPDSAVFSLNQEGEIQGSPPELDLVLGRAVYYNRLSGGAFDPTVQPLVDLFRMGSAGEDELLRALQLVGIARVEMGPREIRFSTPGMGITLDGIAKGFVVDVMAHVLKETGLEHFLLNAGGDIMSEGLREDGEPWQVGIQDPKKEGNLPDVIPLTGMAVATSGSYEIYFDPERTHHHLIDAEAGTSPHQSQSVSVTAPSAMEADALATAVFVMPPITGLEFIESIPGCGCLIVDGNGEALRSSRWHSTLFTPNPEAESQ